MSSHFCENLKKHSLSLCLFTNFQKLLGLGRVSVCRHWYENNEPYMLHVSLSPGTCSCLDVWPGAMAVSSPWQILSLPQLSGSLVRPMIGQLSTRGPLIGWCRPHLMSLLLAIGHTGTTITTCHQLSAYCNVENMRSICMGLYRWRWDFVVKPRWNKSLFSLFHKIRR